MHGASTEQAKQHGLWHTTASFSSRGLHNCSAQKPGISSSVGGFDGDSGNGGHLLGDRQERHTTECVGWAVLGVAYPEKTMDC